MYKLKPLPELATAVGTSKTAFMEVLLVCYERLHGIHPLPTCLTQFGLWHPYFLLERETDIRKCF